MKKLQICIRYMYNCHSIQYTLARYCEIVRATTQVNGEAQYLTPATPKTP